MMADVATVKIRDLEEVVRQKDEIIKKMQGATVELMALMANAPPNSLMMEIDNNGIGMEEGDHDSFVPPPDEGPSETMPEKIDRLQILLQGKEQENQKQKEELLSMEAEIAEFTQLIVRKFEGKNTDIALYDAAREGKLDDLKLALIANGDINFNSRVDGETPLIAATRRGHINIIEYLIQKEAKVNDAKDCHGRTALHYAPEKDIVKILKDAGANLNAQDNSGFTPLMHAAMWLREEVAEFLVQEGAEKHIKNGNNVEAKDLIGFYASAQLDKSKMENILQEEEVPDEEVHDEEVRDEEVQDEEVCDEED